MGSKEVKISMKVYIMRVGLGVVPGEQSFFHENEQNDQEQSHRSEKRNIGTICKGTERNGTERKLLEKNVQNQKHILIIKNVF